MISERAHRDHRDRQVEHRRHLPGAGDQPGRQRRPGRARCPATAHRTRSPAAAGACADAAAPRPRRAGQTRSMRRHLRSVRPVGDRQDRLAVGDHHDLSPGVGRVRTMAASTVASVGVQVCRRLVQQQHRLRRAERTRASPSRCRWPSDSPTPSAPDRPCRRPSGSAASTSSKPAARQAASRSARRAEQVQVLARPCPAPAPGAGQPGHLLPPRASGPASATSTPATVTRPMSAGSARGSPASAVLLPDAVGPGQHGHATGLQRRRQRVRASTVPARRR